MGNGSLPKYSLEKLESMSHADKIMLFHRLRIIELNKIICRILVNVLGNDHIRKTKAKIIHQLYDGNFTKDDKYCELQSVLDSGRNFYDQLDAYTTAAYANYYALFVKYAREVQNSAGIESAIAKAFSQVLSCVRTVELQINADPDKTIPSSLLQAKYRDAVIEYLEHALQTQYNIAEMVVVPGQLKEEDEESDTLVSRFIQNKPRRALNNIERYSMDGNVFYLDADGEFFTQDQL